LSLSYPPSTVVTGSFRQRKYSIYPKVADKTCSKYNIVSTLAISVTRNSVFYLTWRCSVPYAYLSPTCMGCPIHVYSNQIPICVWDDLLSHMSICLCIVPAQPIGLKLASYMSSLAQSQMLQEATHLDHVFLLLEPIVICFLLYQLPLNFGTPSHHT